MVEITFMTVEKLFRPIFTLCHAPGVVAAEVI